MIKTLLTTLLLLASLAMMSLPANALLQKGQLLPEVAGRTIDGEFFSVSSLKGKPFILKIGTTWCGTCGSQAKEINDIRGFLTDNEIPLIEVFIQESAEKVRKFFTKKGFQKPDKIILDNGEITKQLNVYVIPRVILVDKNHQVYRDGDTISSSNLKQKLEQILTVN